MEVAYPLENFNSSNSHFFPPADEDFVLFSISFRARRARISAETKTAINNLTGDNEKIFNPFGIYFLNIFVLSPVRFI